MKRKLWQQMGPVVVLKAGDLVRKASEMHGDGLGGRVGKGPWEFGTVVRTEDIHGTQGPVQHVHVAFIGNAPIFHRQRASKHGMPYLLRYYNTSLEKLRARP